MTRKGINLKTLKQLKEVERRRIKEYAKIHPKAKYYDEGCDNIWKVKCDIALPNATQNEIDKKSAEKLVENGVLGGRGRGQHAFHSRGGQGLPQGQGRVRAGQGGQRRRRCHFRPGDDPEQPAPLLEL